MRIYVYTHTKLFAVIGKHILYLNAINGKKLSTKGTQNILDADLIADSCVAFSACDGAVVHSEWHHQAVTSHGDLILLCATM